MTLPRLVSLGMAATLIAWSTAVLLRQGWAMVAWLPVGMGLVVAFWCWPQGLVANSKRKLRCSG
jgi:hypothetical protein